MGQSLSVYPQLVFAVGQLAVDQVAQCVVGVAVVEHRYNKGRLKVVFQMTSMLTSDEVVKEQIFQTISKNVLRSSKNQKLRACIPHTPHFRIRGFMQATVCCLLNLVF